MSRFPEIVPLSGVLVGLEPQSCPVGFVKSLGLAFKDFQCQFPVSERFKKSATSGDFCGFVGWHRVLYCIVLYSSIYIAPLNSHRQTEALLVRLAPRKETSFKK